MNLHELGITATVTQARGGLVEVTCSLAPAQLRSVLAELPVGAELSAPDPDNGDCRREARRTSMGFEVKRGCHGSHGTWRAAELEEVQAWLSAGIAVLAKFAKPGYGVGLVLPEEAYEG